MLSLLIGTALSFTQPSPLPAKNQSEVAVARRKAYLREMAQQLKLPDISSRKGYVIRLTTLLPAQVAQCWNYMGILLIVAHH